MSQVTSITQVGTRSTQEVYIATFAYGWIKTSQFSLFDSPVHFSFPNIWSQHDACASESEGINVCISAHFLPAKLSVWDAPRVLHGSSPHDSSFGSFPTPSGCLKPSWFSVQNCTVLLRCAVEETLHRPPHFCKVCGQRPTDSSRYFLRLPALYWQIVNQFVAA